MKIPVSVDGSVLNSVRSGHKVRVEDDRAVSGGFLVYERWAGSNGPSYGGAFDSWVENEDDLKSCFVEAGWVVEWSQP